MIIEKEFKKITSKSYYAYVLIEINFSGDFNFLSLANWPSSFDSMIYEECICRGIKEALNDFGYLKPIGSYILKKIKVSNDLDESVPIAYCWAAKLAMKDFLSAVKSKGIRLH